MPIYGNLDPDNETLSALFWLSKLLERPVEYKQGLNIRKLKDIDTNR